jgi:hypothetical protein
VLIPRHVEPLEVLLREVGVGADVHDVDAFHGVVELELLDRPRNDPTSDDALAETGLVRNEKPPPGIRCVVQPVDDVVDRVALKTLEL